MERRAPRALGLSVIGGRSLGVAELRLPYLVQGASFQRCEQMQERAPRVLTDRATPARSVRLGKASSQRDKRNCGVLDCSIHTAISLRTIRIGATADPKLALPGSEYARCGHVRVT